ncbi:hypothetical protein CDN99_26640 [Roseateles aquatilis]|uniref:Uncharacterized protein n=1 Tax=Roseateles aquatilis TaxID=431061 RepID=A0A246ISM3_9BURK|nr:hypothetical protein [Roseateles aquatilis]OWQ83220.1 hypothetical protein CDN99_26640 [Roseateles aquatilis]
MPLDEAIERVGTALERQQLEAASTEVVAQHLGYKSANSGTALSAIASLRYFGLLDRPEDGMLAVTPAFKEFRFNPDEHQRRELLIRFLRTPPLFAELLDLYVGGLPSDANLRYELIQRGFLPSAAEACATVFRRSVEWVDYFRPQRENGSPAPASSPMVTPLPGNGAASAPPLEAPAAIASTSDADAIPVRLSGGRRAWIVVPPRLFEADKLRLKAQIDLLLTVEQETGEA